MNHAEILAHFRLGYGLWILLAIAWQFRKHFCWVRARGTDRSAPQFLGFFTMPLVDVGLFAAVGWALIASLAVATFVSSWSNVALVAASVCSLFYFSQVIDLPAVRRKPNTVPIILLLIGLVRWTDEERAGQVACVAIQILVAQIYFSSGLIKLKQAGWRWVSTSTLQMTLLRYHLRDDNGIAFALARRSTLCRIAALSVLVFELTFWLLIPFPWLAWIYLPAGLFFHFSTAILMRIHYWIYVIPAYLVFVLAR